VSGVALVSFRLGGADGVAVEASKWAWALRSLGHRVTTVAGEGAADVLLPGLAMLSPEPPTEAELAGALADADVVVVENLCSLPFNPHAARLLAQMLRGRAAVLHHHDLPWQRERFAGFPPPPDDASWVHVAINELSRQQLAARGIGAVTVYNSFDPYPVVGDRAAARAALGLHPEDRLLLQPTRAIRRKNIPGGIELAEAIDAVYWLLGPAEEGYDDELAGLLERARVPVFHRYPEAVARLCHETAIPAVAHAYAACDAVVLPSTWEGFGNPAVESAVHHRPLAIGDYPVAAELAAFGFRWFPASDPAALAAWLACPDAALLDSNANVARRHFSLDRLRADVRRLLASRGWLP